MKGILFKPWKTKAIGESSLDREWQTRRLGGLKEINQEPDRWTFVKAVRLIPPVRMGDYVCQHEDGHCVVVKPLYQVNEVVYIKEAWATDKMFDKMTAKQIEETKVATVPLWYKFDDDQLNNPNTTQGRWRSPLFMPAWSARSFIQITDLRPERLQEITLEDIKAEGVIVHYICDEANYRILFQQLWDAINPLHPWSNNDWVLRYEFKKVDKPAEK